MNDLIVRIVLLGETERFRTVGETFRGERSVSRLNDFMLVVAGIGAIVFLFWLVATLMPKEERVRRIDSPRKLFKALCRAHGLDWFSRRTLWKLARQHSPQHPAVLFAMPDALDASMASNPSARQMAAYRRLRVQLFGDVTE
jgi:hypothetical protein